MTLKEQLMRAIRFETFDDPSVLHLAEVAVPAADDRTAWVRVMAASINPSDVKNVAGAMTQTAPPRIPGRDFAGVVAAGPAEWIGAEVLFVDHLVQTFGALEQRLAARH
jgi:NADPH2:quinone reductase